MIRSLIIIFLTPFFLKSQGDLILEKDIIQTLVNYRTKLLTENVRSVDNLRILINKLAEIDTVCDEFESIILSIIYLKNIYKYSNESVLRIVNKNCKNCKYLENIREEDIENIASNSELIDLFLLRTLNPSYPFSIYPKSTIFAEISFYQIEAEQKIGEIGAGNGTFSIILAMLSKEIQISVNEINKGFIYYINTKINKNFQLLDTSKILAIKGTKSNINFSKDQFDRIIIRNSFHHFTKKDKMLHSINQALKHGGKLCLFEPVLESPGPDKRCNKILDKKYLFDIIEKNGFKLEEEKKLEDAGMLLLRFRKK
jgi:SAM-dependent methyltransferase